MSVSSLIFYPKAPLTPLNAFVFLFKQPPSSHPAASSISLFIRPRPFPNGPAHISPYLHALLSRDAHAHVRYLDHADIISPIA